MKWDAFIGGSYTTQAYTADCEETINWYPEVLESTKQRVLYPTPGVTEIASVAVGAGRAHCYINGREFAVVGTSFIEINAAGVVTTHGAVALDSNPATISSNGDGGGQLFITSGGNGYCFTLSTNVLAQVAALNGKATMGDMVDGYFLCLDAATSTLYISNLLDGSTWTTGTDFAQRSLAPDRWVSMKVVNRFIWLFGENTTEPWYNTGATFPFAPHPSGLLQYGCAAPWSVSVVGSDVCWLGYAAGGRVCVLRASGFAPTLISSRPVETAIEGYNNRALAIGDVYSLRGHTFYLLSFDVNNVTWCYDADTGIWHKRGTWDGAQYVVWRPRFHVLAFGEHRTLDAWDGSIYELDPDSTTDVDGSAIRRLRRAPALWDEGRDVFFNAFELDMEVGLGNAVAPGDNPVVLLRISNDGGKTWISEQWRSAGKIGEFSKRVRWHRLGKATRRVFEIVVDDPIPWRITGASLDVERG